MLADLHLIAGRLWLAKFKGAFSWSRSAGNFDPGFCFALNSECLRVFAASAA